MVKSIKVSYDSAADKVLGVDVLTNSTQHGGEYNEREVALITLLLGRLWIHINLYAKADDVERVPRSWDIPYHPGYGWLNSFGEKQTESVDELLAMVNAVRKG